MTTINDSELTHDQSKLSLCTAIEILEKWCASSDQGCRILRVSCNTYTRARQDDQAFSVALDSDQMQRISFVLNIHAALLLIFNNPKNIYGFPTMKNDNKFFNGRSPLEIMAQGDITSLAETYRQIDLLRDAQW